MGSPPLLHQAEYHVRFDEAGPDGHLRPSGYLRFAQDLAWRHSETAGYDRAWYRDRGVHWLVHSVVLEEMASVPYGDVLHATTEVTGWRRVWARRRSLFRRSGGRTSEGGPAGQTARPSDLVADMTIDWVLLDERGRPARVPEEITRHFAPGATFEPARLRLPATPPSTTRWRSLIRRADLDPMGHVNNAAYVDFLEEALMAGRTPGLPRTWHIEYVLPALPDQALTADLWRWGDGWAWRLRGDAAAADADDAGVGGTDVGAGRELCRAVVRKSGGLGASVPGVVSA